jgi:serine/threonine protein kinase
MQFLEGETLAARLPKRAGTGPLDEALRIAIEIADALDKAHRMGIVHRDVKPANIMLTAAGVKLLDFGLAKLQQAAAPAGTGAFAPALLSSPPTATSPLTMQGAVLGTLQYMAPEQLEGATADARSDIFALGAVLYEMLTDRRAFEGKTHASLIGSILKDDPPRLSQMPRFHRCSSTWFGPAWRRVPRTGSRRCTMCCYSCDGRARPDQKPALHPGAIRAAPSRGWVPSRPSSSAPPSRVRPSEG